MSRSKARKGPYSGESHVTHLMSLRESIAWRMLPNHARRILDRLEVEHMRHAGRENGVLRCTYKDFEEAGIPEHAIALAIRQCEALGFLEVTFRAPPSIATYRRSNEYRLTYIFNRGGKPEMTHDWRLVISAEQATIRLGRAAAERSEQHVAKAKPSRGVPARAEAAA